MKRGGFKRPVYERPPRQVHRAGPEYRYGKTMTVRVDPITKEHVIEEHAEYMAAVRSLPCHRCGVVGYSQFCHSDEGKGMGLKTDVRRGWPGCGPRTGIAGCHHDVGTGGLLFKAAKRDYEARAASDTRCAIRLLGLWPRSLPCPEEYQDGVPFDPERSCPARR